MKLLDAEEMEMVSGGIFSWSDFPKEVREAYEREQQRDGGATGNW